MSDASNQMTKALRHLSNRSDRTGEQVADFMQRQTEGEKPDITEFTRILQQRSVTHDAMAAQFKLIEKPMKTVLQETR
ncbi:hypothetical protein EGT07_13445 [Herbaspirillum sp. HC18]|nr:hypothetical protein EGT07_13445 [Herbaspirillum sp. HC18]